MTSVFLMAVLIVISTEFNHPSLVVVQTSISVDDITPMVLQ
jgi:hypothetical protein